MSVLCVELQKCFLSTEPQTIRKVSCTKVVVSGCSFRLCFCSLCTLGLTRSLFQACCKCLSGLTIAVVTSALPSGLVRNLSSPLKLLQPETSNIALHTIHSNRHISALSWADSDLQFMLNLKAEVTCKSRWYTTKKKSRWSLAAVSCTLQIRKWFRSVAKPCVAL